MKTRVCSSCGVEKTYTSEFFVLDNRRKSGLGSQCRVCRNLWKKEWRGSRPAEKRSDESNARRREVRAQKPSEEIAYIGRKQNLMARYGMTVEEYDRLYEEQDGLCAICEKPDPTGRLLAVDHSHVLGVVRSLLCGKCNRGIGMFDDDPDLIRRAAEYVESHYALA